MTDIIEARDLRPGNTFLNKGSIYLVIENSFNKTAMREGIVKCKVKNLRTGATTIDVLTGERFEKVILDNRQMVFNYVNGNNYVFMDNETFETIEINVSRLEWEKNFLEEGTQVNILCYQEEILGITLPDQVLCQLKDCEEAVQGNTVQAVQKKGWLLSGYEVNLPQFIKKTDKIIIDTKTGNYVGRKK